MGGHVLVKYVSSGWHILQYIMFYRKTCLTGGHVYLRVGIIGGHVLLLEMSYWGMVGWHVFHENMCYGRTCIVGGHVLQVCAEATI